jgi:hypothetical protein
LRNGVFWEGESIELGDVFRAFGNLPKIPLAVTPLENLNDVVWWKEDLAGVADQIPVKQARVHLQLRTPELNARKIRITRNGRPWRVEPVVSGTRWEFFEVEEER